MQEKYINTDEVLNISFRLKDYMNSTIVNIETILKDFKNLEENKSWIGPKSERFFEDFNSFCNSGSQSIIETLQNELADMTKFISDTVAAEQGTDSEVSKDIENASDSIKIESIALNNNSAHNN